MGIEPGRHEAYRQLIAQSIHEIYRILSAAEPAVSKSAARQDGARRAAILLAEAVFPLAQASAADFAGFDQQLFWLRFEAALRETGEFSSYPAQIRSRNRH